MTFLAFILGVLLGVAFYCWKQHQTDRQLKQTLISLPDNEGKLPSLSTVSLLRREINHRNQQRQQLEESLSHWQNLLELAPIGYLHVDEENHLLWANQLARDLLRIDRWQPGAQIRLLLELVRSYELDQLIEKTRQSQQPQVQEWTFYSNNYDFEQTRGEIKGLLLKGSSIPLPNQEVGVFLENWQSFRELSQASNRTISDLAHEFRTPLTSIRLVAEALQKRVQGSERRWVEQLLREVNRLINLVHNFTEINNLETNPAGSLVLQSVDIKALIFSVWQTLNPLAERKELSLVYSGPEPTFLPGDQARLIQVFLNLFDNSIKYSPRQTTIYVDVEVTEIATEQPNDLNQLNNTLTTLSADNNNLVIINIIDSGSGFAPADLPYVFNRLYRGDTSRQRPTYTKIEAELSTNQGSGLGLAIVKQIIQAHGGSVSAQNHPETGGAWLQIKLPR